MEIRKAKESDEKGIRALFAESFGRELSLDEWKWKYKDSPWGSTAIVVVDNDKIVAHYGSIKSRFYFKGRMFDVFQPCDVMTHPKYRARFFTKKGVMVKAGELFFSNNHMDFAFGFPSERHAILGTKQLGYTEHKYISALKKYIDKKRYVLNPLTKIASSWNLINASEIDLLWDTIKDDNGLSIEKKSHYIIWRYKDNPVKSYKPFIVRDRLNNKLKAFCVFSINENGLSVMDFLCPKGFQLKFFSLLENFVFEHKLISLRLWLNPKEDIHQKLVKIGYNEDKAVPLLFKILNQEITSEFLFENYRYRMGDYDAS